MNLKRILAAGVMGLTFFLAGCSNNAPLNSSRISKPAAVELSRPSYKLEDLCSSDLSLKNIKINVYIEDSKILWDYHKYKEEIFGYVEDFFKENLIDCRVVYSDSRLSPFQSSSDFGVEILESEARMKERFAYLSTGINFDPNEIKLILEMRGYAATRAGIALINGCSEEFKEMIKAGEMNIKDVEDQYPRTYKGTTVRKYLFRGYAANICHELGHCMTLAHANTFPGLIIEDKSEGVPNLMTYENPVFTKERRLGYCLSPLQQKLIHNFIAGGNNYQAFVDSLRELDIYLERVSRENHLSVE
jgi:hypothetical protein